MRDGVQIEAKEDSQSRLKTEPTTVSQACSFNA